ELDSNGTRAGGYVQHGVRRPRLDPAHEEAPPAAILAEREQACVPVVRRPERRKEVECPAPTLRDLCHTCNLSSAPWILTTSSTGSRRLRAHIWRRTRSWRPS